jgi:uncharacterized membrane protein YvbJ
MKKCRFCAEQLDDAARVCTHCGWAVATRAQLDKAQHDSKARRVRITFAAWGVGICAVVILLVWGTLVP